MHNALRRAVCALRSPAGSLFASPQCTLPKASADCALRALSASALPAASQQPGRITDSVPCADGQSGRPAARKAPWQPWSQLPHEHLSPVPSLRSWEPGRCDAPLRRFATRPHSVAGRRVAAAQQRARSRPPPPTAQDASTNVTASRAGSAPTGAASAAPPPQQSAGPGGEVAPDSTDAMQPLPASLHEV